jgi:hypothetical protein
MNISGHILTHNPLDQEFIRNNMKSLRLLFQIIPAHLHIDSKLADGTLINFSTGEGNSITNIATQFHNSGTGSYYLRKALTQSGNIITSTTGSDKFIAALAILSKLCQAV